MSRDVNVAEPIVGSEAYDNIEQVLDSGQFVQGQFVDEFEDKWADFCGVNHAIAVSNGTTAIQLALNAVGLEPGQEVIVPSLTFGSTATAIVHQGGVPVFCDVDRDIYTLDHTDLERCLSDQTKAIIPVHLYGHPAEMDEICEFADDYGISVIEDAAQAHGARYKDDVVGSIGDLGCFSFYATKNITSGEGGMITTNDDRMAAEIRKLRNHGLDGRDTHVELGYNYRMSELNGAVGTEQVDRLREFNERRREISNRLRRELADVEWLRSPPVREYVDHAFFWAPFEVRTEKVGMSGKEVWKELKERGVETRHRYTTPLYEQPVFSDHLGFNSEFPWSENPREHNYNLTLPNVEAVVGNTIGLPNHPNISEEDIQYVVDTIRSFPDG